MDTSTFSRPRTWAAAMACSLLMLTACQGPGTAAPTGSTPPAADASAGAGQNVRILFDGKSLGQWKPTEFGGGAEIEIDDGCIILPQGYDMTGITWTGDVVRMNYEISLEAKRMLGNDFFCGLTFPVGDDPCSFIVGGWGGGVVGLSSLDNLDAANNDTTKYLRFQDDRWYRIRLRVTPNRIQAWIDEEPMVDVDTTDRQVGIRNEVQRSMPLGIATWRTTAAIRNIKLKVLQ